MEVADMKFVFNPTRQDYWVQNKLFPATPSWSTLVNDAHAMGFDRLRPHRPWRRPEGRDDRQPQGRRLQRVHPRHVLHEVGRLDAARVHHLRHGQVHDGRVQGRHPQAHRAGPRLRHRAQRRRPVEPTCRAASPTARQAAQPDLLPAVAEPPRCRGAQLAPRSDFTMKPDGSSGLTESGEGIPNIDSVKKTIATYYGDPGTGIADKTCVALHHRARGARGAQHPATGQRVPPGRARRARSPPSCSTPTTRRCGPTTWRSRT